MNQYKIIYVIIVFSIIKSYGQDHKISWPVGYHSDWLPNNNGTGFLSVSNFGSKVNNYRIEANIENTVAIYVKNSKLLLYSNGCEIYNGKTNEILAEKSIQKQGDFSKLMCPQYGMNIRRGALFVENPVDSNLIYFIYLSANPDPHHIIVNYGIYFSIIKYDYNVDSFRLVEQDIKLLEENIESISIVKHGNGKDYWLLSFKKGSNEYLLHLIDSGGIHFVKNDKTGNNLSFDVCDFINSSIFSPDGNYLARFNHKCGLNIYKFERCTGNLQYLDRFRINTSDNLEGDISFSPDSKLLYILSANFSQSIICRLKLLDIGTKVVPYTLDTLKLGVLIDRCELMPNGEIYVCSPASSKAIHTISNTNEFSDKIQFNYDKILFDYFIMPSLPYLYNDTLGVLLGSHCDSTIVSLENIEKADINIYPIPFSSTLNIESYHIIKQIDIFNTLGQVIIKYYPNSSYAVIEFKDSKSFGIYYLKVRTNYNTIIKKISKN
ncbi:MAG: T9SS type A sorting domain-containing protein [Saprospiraceae bacterium]